MITTTPNMQNTKINENHSIQQSDTVTQKVEYETISGLPLLQAQRQPCHHPEMESTEFEFESDSGVDESEDFLRPSREGHHGKLWDPNRFHILKNDEKKYYQKYQEYLSYWYRQEKDDTNVWYGKPNVTFRINNCPSISRANSF